MSRNQFNNLPHLSKKDALEILNKPIDNSDLSVNYYKAVFHLANYPCNETEQVLLNLIKSDNDQLEFNIARRKAIEVLASFEFKEAIPVIASYLNNNDSYLVETVIWSLSKLKCKDKDIINQISLILYSSFENKRIVIQALSNLGVKDQIEKIRLLSNDEKLSSGVKGASISFLIRHAGEKERLNELIKFLELSNQNDRHCAVQDIINSGCINAIPSVVRAPISPSFKIKAIDSLWLNEDLVIDNINLINIIDSIIIDDPNWISTLQIDDFIIDKEFLINQLFHTDFNRCYHSMIQLSKFSPDEILYSLNLKWASAKRDYGAIYFFINLYIILLNKGIYDKGIFGKIDFLLGDSWPDYMKFRSSTILLWSRLDDERFYNNFLRFSDETVTPYWVNRYSALLSLELNKYHQIDELSKLFLNDKHRFVREKAKQITL